MNRNQAARRLWEYHKLTKKGRGLKFRDYEICIDKMFDDMGEDNAIAHLQRVYPGIQFDRKTEVFDLPDDSTPTISNQQNLF